MFERQRAAHKIKQYQRQIEQIEEKMNRSQAAFMEAFLSGQKPSEEDVMYHHSYVEEIKKIRCEIQKLQEKLK